MREHVEMSKKNGILGMRRNIFALTAFVVMPFSTAAQDVDERLCETYARLYDGANQEIASIKATGIFDDSAPRETVRQLQTLDQRLRQFITMQQMEFYGCDLPKMPSDSIQYYSDALACELEGRRGRTNSPECDRGEWKNSLSDLEHFR